MDKVKIYKDCYSLLILIYKSMNEMPRKERFSLGAKMTECSLAMLDSITLAYQARAQIDRLNSLGNFFRSFTRLQTYLRLCLDLSLLSLNTLSVMHPLIDDISKQYITIQDDYSKIVIKKEFTKHEIIKNQLLKQKLCYKNKLTKSISRYMNLSTC